MFERIVVTVDGSEPARRALPFAADLASRYGSEVIVIFVFEEEETVFREPDSLMPPPGALDIADRAARLLKDVGVSARAEVRSAPTGGAAREIVRVASEEDAGLIVTGILGTSDWRGLVVGSVAHEVARLSRVPVLIVR
jgi:nucleotide-binding universal stress UspA family protein